MDLTAVGAAVSSLRAAGDIAKGLISLHTMAEVQAKAIELNGKIIDAQHKIFEANAAQTALVDRVRELEGQIARMKDWDAQQERYQLARPYTGVPAYALKKAMSNGEAAHYLCANCFQSGKRSFLQHGKDKIGFVTLACAACKFEGRTEWRGVGADKYAEEITQTE